MSEMNLLSPAQMKHLLEVTRLLAVTTELDPLLQRIAEAAVDVLGAERASIFLHDAERDELVTRVAMGSATIRVPAGRGIVGAAFASGQVVHVPDAYADARFNRDVDRSTGFKTRDILSAAMADVTGRPLGVLQVINSRSDRFDESDRLLIQLLADQAGVAIQRYRLQQDAMQAATLRREVELARRVQERMLPVEGTAPQVGKIDVAGWARPASVTAGDCYDFWKLPDGRLGLFLADACGHGLGPTLVVSQVRSLVRSLSEIEIDPWAVLNRVNARLHADLDEVRFVTAFFAMLASDGTARFVSAGHGPILVRRGASQPIEEVLPTEAPLGVMDAWAECTTCNVELAPGSTLIVVSDGIIEARNSAGEQFGVERTIRAIDGAGGASSPDLAAALRAALDGWMASIPAADDQTLLIASLPANWSEPGAV
ncbi:MAG TPA: GAF domain-containing SpoIIE family protein phosphatase [Tepidisphaeraceae bacterium]|nr:GAF domain-containing SpoIIE family protein phosphatase [Tepidisphaeraceae bacterium]